MSSIFNPWNNKLIPGYSNNPLDPITSDTTLTDEQLIVEVDASGGDVIISFPTAIGRANRGWSVTRIDDTVAYVVTLNPSGSELIRGLASLNINFQWTSYHVYSNGVGLNIR